MKTLSVFKVLGVLLLGYAGFWYWHSLTEGEPGSQLSEVAQAINQCDLVASKAATELPEVLPFQKLEKAARQSRVLDRCMQDHGYAENPAWVTQANQQATRIAHEQGISEAEAYETLRRQAMLKVQPGMVGYWRKHA